MPRPIKFRAWDIEKNCWLKDGFSVDEDGSRLYTADQDEYVVGEDVWLIQFTGLTDKNGKEIYEGDIIQYRTPQDFSNRKTRRVVTWTGSRRNTGFNLASKMIGTWEIIGNIYENPELLK